MEFACPYMPLLPPGRPISHDMHSPMYPLATSSAATRNSLALRCCDPTWNVTPVSFATRAISLPSLMPRDIGFWQ